MDWRVNIPDFNMKMATIPIYYYWDLHFSSSFFFSLFCLNKRLAGQLTHFCISDFKSGEPTNSSCWSRLHLLHELYVYDKWSNLLLYIRSNICWSAPTSFNHGDATFTTLLGKLGRISFSFFFYFLRLKNCFINNDEKCTPLFFKYKSKHHK